VHLGTLAEVLGLVTWNVSWSAILVQARLVTIGRQYEEAAADLSCPPLQAIRRVLLSFVVAGLGFLGYRWLSRGERIDRQATLTTIAGA
jgi:spermidine/putrescine transport system permease protein